MTTESDAITVVPPSSNTIRDETTEEIHLQEATEEIPLQEEREGNSQKNDIKDTKYERILRKFWDLTIVHEHAQFMQSNIQLSRLLIKVTNKISRPRTRELSMGLLVNLARHEDIKQLLMDDKDILLLCRSLLWYENNARVLLETTRLLNTFFKYVTLPSLSLLSSKFLNDTKEEVEHEDKESMNEDDDDQQQQQQQQQQQHKQNTLSPSSIIKHEYLNLFLIPIDKSSPSIYHQYTQIIMNTSNSELLYSSLQLLTSITIYIHGITLPSESSFLMILHNNDYNDGYNEYGDQNEKLEREKIIDWAIERLNKETNGIDIGVELNGAIVNSILYLVWTFLYFHLLDHRHQYLSRLDPSLTMITNHLRQKNDSDKTSNKQNIECLVNALRDIKL